MKIKITQEFEFVRSEIFKNKDGTRSAFLAMNRKEPSVILVAEYSYDPEEGWCPAYFSPTGTQWNYIGFDNVDFEDYIMNFDEHEYIKDIANKESNEFYEFLTKHYP